VVISFDSIPHSELLQCVARRIVDRDMLHLIRMWLKVPVTEWDDNGKRHVMGGRHSTCGTPQGGVISPLLANIYMNRFLKHWRRSRRGEAYQAQIVNYADDFVILSRGSAAQALNWTRNVMTRLGLTLNEAKTTLKNARQERFDFLGYTFGPYRHRKYGYGYLGASPSQKSVARVRESVRDLLTRQNLRPWPEVRDQLNRVLRGWAAYFCYGTRLMAYRAVDNFVPQRVRAFLCARHKIAGRGTREFPDAMIFQRLGVLRLRHVHLGPPTP
jgi:RNA-directed DNA polymerase